MSAPCCGSFAASSESLLALGRPAVGNLNGGIAPPFNFADGGSTASGKRPGPRFVEFVRVILDARTQVVQVGDAAPRVQTVRTAVPPSPRDGLGHAVARATALHRRTAGRLSRCGRGLSPGTVETARARAAGGGNRPGFERPAPSYPAVRRHGALWRPGAACHRPAGPLVLARMAPGPRVRGCAAPNWALCRHNGHVRFSLQELLIWNFGSP